MIKNSFSNLSKKEKIRSIVALVLYIGWVVWIGNYWFLLGLPIVVDIYITKKVNWSPWKKKEGKNHIAIEWLDAIIFAIIAVTIINIFLFQNYKIPTPSMEQSLRVGDHLYVSKVAYGPRVPNTPLALPFLPNFIPGTSSKSYSELVSWDYKRLKGFAKIKRDDPVVFNFPEGDTVAYERRNESYYGIVLDVMMQLKAYDINAQRELLSDDEYYAKARKKVKEDYTVKVHPMDKTDNYIKRCVGVPGDSLEVIDGNVYINGKLENRKKGVQFDYLIFTDGQKLNVPRLKKNLKKKYGVYQDNLKFRSSGTRHEALVSNYVAEELQKMKFITRVEKYTQPKGLYDYRIWPHDERYPWNNDQFGPIYIPKAGAEIEINLENLPLYERVIGHYEKNKLAVKDSVIYINDEPATTYTFKQNYYWMMGDNRQRSLDARFWGYVPEDHIIGKPRFVWLSIDQEERFPKSIRLKRMFTWIR
ncbi:MAG: S26 family signal peptidase [Bacteroidales bacterium]|nr:S26 family signal peptidase [Bacteroidales bacterium]